MGFAWRCLYFEDYVFHASLCHVSDCLASVGLVVLVVGGCRCVFPVSALAGFVCSCYLLLHAFFVFHYAATHVFPCWCSPVVFQFVRRFGIPITCCVLNIIWSRFVHIFCFVLLDLSCYCDVFSPPPQSYLGRALCCQDGDGTGGVFQVLFSCE